jgi:hypothetical protein
MMLNTALAAGNQSNQPKQRSRQKKRITMKKILLTSLAAFALLAPLTQNAEAYGWRHYGYYGYHHRAFCGYGYHHRYWHHGYWNTGYWYPGFWDFYPAGPTIIIE